MHALLDQPSLMLPAAERLLMQQPSSSSSDRVIHELVMSATFGDRRSGDAALDDGLLFRDWDCDSCAPPIFDLPPPPRPPWLEEIEDCESNPTRAQQLDQLESCEHNTVFFVGGGDGFEDAFHSAAVVLVCSLVFVTVVLGVGFAVFRRRKSLFYYRQQCGQQLSGSSQPVSPCISDEDIMQQQQQQQQQRLYFQQLQDSMKRSSTLRRLSASNSVNHFGNHYIPDVHGNKHRFQQHQQLHQAATLSHHHHLQDTWQQPQQQPQHHSATLCAGNVAVGNQQPTTLMELSTMPPPAGSQSTQYPHILIGGQPFYLVPTDPAMQQQSVELDQNEMSYAYPQHVGPIYEEIDPYAASVAVTNTNNFVPVAESECSVASDQGELGSVKLEDPRLSSQHHQYSQNSSDLSCSNSDSGINNPQKSPPSSSSSSSSHQQGRRAKQPRVLVNPMVRDVLTEDGFKDTSFTSDDVKQYPHKQPHVFGSCGDSSGRSTVGSCAKLQFSPASSSSVSSTSKPPQRSPAANSSSSSSVYYYSDTLRKREESLPPAKRLIRDVSEGRRRSSSAKRSSNVTNPVVDTKIVLADAASGNRPTSDSAQV